jgi:cytochrome c553
VSIRFRRSTPGLPGHIRDFAIGLSIGLIATLSATPPRAQVTTLRVDARVVAANCANCHGTTGHAVGATPSLAGRDKGYLAEQLRAFRDGKRAGTIMPQLAKGYTDDEIDAVSEHFALRRPQ